MLTLRTCLVALFLAVSASTTTAFVPCHTKSCRDLCTTVPQSSRIFAKDSDWEDDDDDEGLALQDEDWRAFRAKLFMSEQQEEKAKSESSTIIEDDGDLDGIGSLFSASSTVKSDSLLDGMTALDPSQWAYESGDVIEQGAVILGGVEQDFGFGLRQQYFHKAAILVLDHDENTFTKGIILNRPTDLLLEDDINEGQQWRVWFGGDVEGLSARNPDIVCLHSLDSTKAAKASIPLMKDIQWTTFTNAKKLVKAGVAEVRDFWGESCRRLLLFRCILSYSLNVC